MKHTGILLILAAGCCWGTAPIFTNGLFEAGATSFQVAGIRALIACSFYWLVGLQKEGRKILCSPKNAAMLMVTGSISIGTMYLTYTFSMFLFGASLAVIFLYTAPVYVALYMAVTGRERVGILQVIGILLIMAGTTVSVGFAANMNKPTGVTVVVGIACGISYALVTIFRKTIQANFSVFQVAAYTSLGASIVLIPFLELSSIPFNEKTCVCFLGNAIISTALPQFLYLMGLDSDVPGAVGSSLAAIELIVAGICGVVLLGESTSLTKITGLGIVFIGVVLAAQKKLSSGKSSNIGS